MLGSIVSTLGAKKDALEAKLMLYIVVGIVAIVVVSLLLDGIRHFIRGLDTAALGALLLWLGHKASAIKLVSVLSNLLYLIGGTLFAVGILVFILLKLLKRKRRARGSKPPVPKSTKAALAEQMNENERTEP